MTTIPPPDGARKPRPTRHRGPVLLRGGEPDPQTVGTTTDQRLLDRRGPTDCVTMSGNRTAVSSAVSDRQ